MITLTIAEKKVNIFPADQPDQPVIYLNTFANEGGHVYKALEKMNPPDFSLISIGDLNWDHDMAPWDIPPISKHDTPCTGGADDFLEILLDQILPEAEKEIPGEPKWRGLTGYSLAGLFAVYAIFQTNVFSRIATMSGSLWYPDLKEYIFSHEMKRKPDCAFFSLGEKESKTKNPYLKTVQDNTDAIQKYFAEQGIDSIFRLNPGNHYVNGTQRTADGIDWILRK